MPLSPYPLFVFKGLYCKSPPNFHIYKTLPQLEILSFADVFITHESGNSVNEAIDLGVPLIVIPFMFDQHQCASNIEALKIGITFQHCEADQDRVIDAESGKYFRESLSDPLGLVAAIKELINNNSYHQALKKLK